MEKKSTFILHTPGVNSGGGLVLLRALLSAPETPPMIAHLDARIRFQLDTPSSVEACWCAPNFWGRLKAEIRLFFTASRGDVVLCFHGLPPLLPCAARVIVFIQNRLNLADTSPGRSSIRASLKRLLFRLFASNANEFIVQTRSMRLAVQECLGSAVPVKVLPFLDALAEQTSAVPQKKDFDFIYVADGMAHKNHRILLRAWILLAREGIRPSLVLTLGARDKALRVEIEQTAQAYGLLIHNFGDLSREQIFGLYRRTQALVFPSTAESFGIPLMEATAFGLPVIASERDFVRDVCVPQETFDPASADSVAHAVRRYLGVAEKPEPLRSANEFIDELLQR